MASDGAQRRILIVEDEALISLMLEEMLSDLGYAIAGVAPNAAEAEPVIQRGELDGAVIDLNLSGGRSYPLADLMLARRIPFVFSTGYSASSLPEPYRGCAILQKPYDITDLSAAMSRLFG